MFDDPDRLSWITPELPPTRDYGFASRRVESAIFGVFEPSGDHAQKVWTRHERRSALARALMTTSTYFPRFATELPGFRPTIGYVDLREIAPATLVEFVLKKLERA